MTDIASIDAWLPQTQCTRCGYPDCRAYAAAIAARESGIDRCPPGGDVTLRGLAELLGVPVPQQLSADLDPFDGYRIVRILEPECIGCTKCITACPVDAIVGSGKMMHTVIDELCTGCELCIPPCPVDCIEPINPNRVAEPFGRWPDYPESAPKRFRAARNRLTSRSSVLPASSPTATSRSRYTDEDSMQREILEAVRRSRKRRSQSKTSRNR